MPNVKIDPNDIAIRLKGLKKSFGPQTVLEDVNLDIRRAKPEGYRVRASGHLQAG